MVRLTVRIDLDDGSSLGPGKIALLEAIEREGSIAAAARALGMSYRRAWLLIDALNAAFPEPAVERHTGGKAGGGARVTDAGRDLVARYRRIVEISQQAAARDLDALKAAGSGSSGDGTAEQRRPLSRGRN